MMFVDSGEATIFTTAFGPRPAPAILGIGGWIGNWELWAGPFSVLSERWRTLAYDHRGSGATQAPVETITFDQLVEDVFAVLDAYGVERAVLAAESAGALTALGAALQRPERVSGLVIVDGFYFQNTPADADRFLAGLKSDYARTLDWFVEACVPEADCEHIKRWGRQILQRASPEAALALYRVPGSVDLRGDLGRINQPTLILHGEADALVSVEAARWLAKTLPNAQLTLLPGAGHVPTMTRPEAVAQAMARFLES
jgi:pimeloyl-ACP methyl ester carboxylesterase